jgi:hypothetical protein
MQRKTTADRGKEMFRRKKPISIHKPPEPVEKETGACAGNIAFAGNGINGF